MSYEYESLPQLFNPLDWTRKPVLSKLRKVAGPEEYSCCAALHEGLMTPVVIVHALPCVGKTTLITELQKLWDELFNSELSALRLQTFPEFPDFAPVVGIQANYWTRAWDSDEQMKDARTFQEKLYGVMAQYHKDTLAEADLGRICDKEATFQINIYERSPYDTKLIFDAVLNRKVGQNTPLTCEDALIRTQKIYRTIYQPLGGARRRMLHIFLTLPQAECLRRASEGTQYGSLEFNVLQNYYKDLHGYQTQLKESLRGVNYEDVHVMELDSSVTTAMTLYHRICCWWNCTYERERQQWSRMLSTETDK